MPTIPILIPIPIPIFLNVHNGGGVVEWLVDVVVWLVGVVVRLVGVWLVVVVVVELDAGFGTCQAICRQLENVFIINSSETRRDETRRDG